ncbi:hypothetical protein OH492_14010 [Vibrio chagasii]|nr:hypothetical protein [Vibrio chagasii]
MGIAEGMFPAVGAVREVGDGRIIEDVAFPVENLQMAFELQSCSINTTAGDHFCTHHALEGNLHFVFVLIAKKRSTVVVS